MAEILKYSIGASETINHRFSYVLKEKLCLERCGQNVEIWPWSIGANKSLLFIYVVKEIYVLRGMARILKNIAVEPQG